MTDPNESSSIVAAQGLRVDGADPESLAAAVQAATDYRGDVTITRKSTGGPTLGFIFDCHLVAAGEDSARSSITLLPQDGGGKVRIPVDDIDAIVFTGKDTAAGKSFHAWMKRYVEKKLAGKA